MKRGLLIFVLVTVVFLSQNVLAVTIDITAKTEPYHNIFVQVAEPNSELVLYKIGNKTDVSGTIEFEFTTTLKELTFFVQTRHPLTKEIVYETWFYEIPVDTEMEINVLAEEGVEEYEIPEATENSESEIEAEVALEGSNENSNETEETIEEVIEETPEENIETGELTAEKPTKNGITGLFISEETGKMSNVVYFIALGAIIFGILLVIFLHKRSSAAPHTKEKTTTNRKISRGINPFGVFKKNKSSLEERLAAAQRKIKEAEAEIDYIKRKDPEIKRAKEIEEARKQFKEAKERLGKLKGESFTSKSYQKELSPNEKGYKEFQDKY